VSDTSPTAAELQTRIHRRLGGVARLKLAMDMSTYVRELARLRQQHPDWSERALKRELIRYAFLPGPLPPALR